MASTTDQKTIQMNTIRAAGTSAGLLAGLAFAFHRKSKFWGYVGWGLLGSIAIGAAVGLATLPMQAKIAEAKLDEAVK